MSLYSGLCVTCKDMFSDNQREKKHGVEPTLPREIKEGGAELGFFFVK